MIYQTGFVSFINIYLYAYKSVNYDAFGLVEDVESLIIDFIWPLLLTNLCLGIS